jgi:nucleoid DNA-binding protein
MKAIVRRLARRSRISNAAAADQVDRIIHDVLSKLKKGEPARIPGLGSFESATKFMPEKRADEHNC